MRLICRECSATYEAPDDLFGAQPRAVRCNRCGYQWTVPAAPPLAASGSSAPPAPIAQPAASAPMQPPPPAAPAAAARDTADSDTRPITPEPVSAIPASTRTLLEGHQTGKRTAAMPDIQERRLAHDTLFDPAPSTRRRSGINGWSIWIAAMVIVLLVISAILFEPQVVQSVPALAKVYRAVGL